MLSVAAQAERLSPAAWVAAVVALAVTFVESAAIGRLAQLSLAVVMDVLEDLDLDLPLQCQELFPSLDRRPRAHRPASTHREAGQGFLGAFRSLRRSGGSERSFRRLSAPAVCRIWLPVYQSTCSASVTRTGLSCCRSSAGDVFSRRLGNESPVRSSRKSSDTR